MTSAPSKFAPRQKPIMVTAQTHADLTAIKTAIEDQEDRQVTYPEVVRRLVDLWNLSRADPIIELHGSGVVRRGGGAGS